MGAEDQYLQQMFRCEFQKMKNEQSEQIKLVQKLTQNHSDSKPSLMVIKMT